MPAATGIPDNGSGIAWWQSRVAVPAVYIIFGIIGMSVGMVVSVSVMNMGIKGMFVYIVMTFPHYIIYAITIFILISIWETSRGSYVNINIRKIAMALLVSFILLLAGTLCEAYVNPGCLKMLLFPDCDQYTTLILPMIIILLSK